MTTLSTLADVAEEAWEVVDEYAARIASLEAEVVQLQTQLAEWQATTHRAAKGEIGADWPKDGRRKISEQTRQAILADLAAGFSQSQAARRHGVSAMTASRLARGG